MGRLSHQFRTRQLSPDGLAAVVQLVFHWVRCVLVGVNLFPLQIHVTLKLGLGEHVTGQQVVVVCFESVERFAQGATDCLDVSQLLWWQVVQVFV